MKRTHLFQFNRQSGIPESFRQAIASFLADKNPVDPTEALRIPNDESAIDMTASVNSFENFHNKDSILNMHPHLNAETAPVQSIRDLSPKQALRLLTHSAWERRPITIVTVAETPIRRFRSVISAPLDFIYCTLTARPLPLSIFVFTILVPLLPIMATWDLVAEMLGNYSEEELNDLAEHIHVPGYRFKTGTMVERGKPACHYLIGFPELRKAA